MRQDQYEKLLALEEKLMDVFLHEAEPDKWPGHGLEPGAMDQSTRGDRYWSKKNPTATLVLVCKIQSLVQQTQQFGDTPPPMTPPPGDGRDDAQDLDAIIDGAEREAKKLMKKMLDSGAKGAKSHGRA